MMWSEMHATKSLPSLVWFALPAVVLVLLFCMAPVTALGVLGAKYTGSISPGGTDTHVLTIDLGSDESATDLQVSVEGFGQTADGHYTPLDPAEDVSPYSARSFITLDNSTLHLQPGTTQSIRATITLPQNVGAGGRYAIIYVRTLPGAASLTTAVAVPVFITVAGTTPTETGSIVNVDPGTVTIGQPISITTSFKNTGNYHYYGASNEVTITDANGSIVGNVTTTPMVTAIIPGNTINFVGQPSVTNLQTGTYTVDSKVLVGGNVLDEKNTTFTIKENYVPPATSTSITVSPGSAATLTSPDGRYSIAFPQGSVLSDVVVTIQSIPLSNLNSPPSGAKIGASSFEVTGLAGLLSKPATVTVMYSADDLAAAGGDASQLKLAYFDAAQNSWVILPTQVNTQATTLTATTTQLGTWAVMVSSSSSGGSQSGAGWKLPLPPVISIIALLAAVLIIKGTARRKR